VAITGTFLANFDQFVAAAKGAEVSLQGVETGAAKIGTSVESLKGVATSLAGAFGIGFSVTAIVGFGKELLEAASELNKLHNMTGISVEGLQRFQVAGDDAGNTITDLTSAIVKMEDKLAGGDRSAAGALQKLGLSFADLKGLTPERQFIAISDAIRQIPDPAQQVSIAIDLFGKQGATVLPTLKRGFDDLKDSAVGMSRETVRALSETSDALGKFWRSAKGVAGTGLGTLILTITDSLGVIAMKNALDDATAAATKAAPAFKSLAVPGLPEDLAKIRQMEDELTKSAEASIVANKAFADSLKATSVIEHDAHALSMDWVRDLNAAKASANLEQMQGAVKTINDIAALEREAATLRMGLYATDTEMRIQAAHDWFDDEVAKLNASDLNYKQHYNALLDVESLRIAKIQQGTEAVVAGAAREVAAIAGVTAGYWAQVDAAAAAAGAALEAAGGAYVNVGKRAPSITDPGFSSGFSLKGTGAGWSDGGIHPLRDGGGPVTAGQSYVVGANKQPELFTPGASGFITPMGGGVTVINHFTIIDTAENLAQRTADLVMQTAKRAMQFGAA